jgi:hypothetical protein
MVLSLIDVGLKKPQTGIWSLRSFAGRLFGTILQLKSGQQGTIDSHTENIRRTPYEYSGRVKSRKLKGEWGLNDRRWLWRGFHIRDSQVKAFAHRYQSCH